MSRHRKQEQLRIYNYLAHSLANGPGVRAVVWVQGCSLGCSGCFNPGTHAFDAGYLVSVDELFSNICSLGSTIEGITLTGGEPLQQLTAMKAFLQRIRAETTLSTIVFTGYSWEEIQSTGRAGILGFIDVLIAGRYIAAQRLAHGLRGSTNKTLHMLTNRYTQKSIENTPSAEILIHPDGSVVVSGINPPQIDGLS